MLTMNYALEQEAGFKGMLADCTCKTTESYAAEVAMNAGVPVVLGTNPEKQVNAVASADDCKKVIGIVQHVHKEVPDCECAKYYPACYCVPVLTRGRVFVAVDDAVEAGAPAKYDFANEVWSATNGTAVEGITFKTSTSAKGVAVVEIA